MFHQNKSALFHLAANHHYNLAKWFANRTALAGNRTRVSRVAGENSTTEPPGLAGHSTHNFRVMEVSGILHP